MLSEVMFTLIGRISDHCQRRILLNALDMQLGCARLPRLVPSTLYQFSHLLINPNRRYWYYEYQWGSCGLKKSIISLTTAQDLNPTLSLESILLTRHLKEQERKKLGQAGKLWKSWFSDNTSQSEDEERTEKAKISARLLPTPSCINV